MLYAVFTGRRAYDGSAYCSGHLLYSVLSINIYKILPYFFIFFWVVLFNVYMYSGMLYVDMYEIMFDN